jgi:GTPase SAR1 family protein
MEEHRLLKVVVCGSMGVGKTSMLRRIVDHEFSAHEQSTIGCDFKMCDLRDGHGNLVKLQIWDTAGQERFRAVTTQYFRGAHVILFVYDVGSAQSFSALPDWFQMAGWIHSPSPRGGGGGAGGGYVSAHTPFTHCFLIGNKVDTERRQITTENGEDVAFQYGMGFKEVSAKTGEGIDEVLRNILMTMLLYNQALKDAGSPSLFVMKNTETVTLALPADGGGEEPLTLPVGGGKKCC